MARYNGALPLPLGLIEHPESEEMEKLETENTRQERGEIQVDMPSEENVHNCPWATQMSKQEAFCEVGKGIGII